MDAPGAGPALGPPPVVWIYGVWMDYGMLQYLVGIVGPGTRAEVAAAWARG